MSRTLFVDARTSTEALFTISAGNREEVDQLVNTAVANGGSTVDDAQDHGVMNDWGVMWMDVSQA